MNITQIIAKIIITLVCTWFYIIVLISVWRGEINLPKWTKSKIENVLPVTSMPVNISPERITLNANAWRGVSSFNIYNNTAETLYDIYVKLEIEGIGIKAEDIEVTPKNISDFIAVQLGSGSVNFYIVQFWGTDIKGREFIYLIPYSLLPHESQSFRVSVKRTSSSNLNQAKIYIKFVQNSKIPAQISFQDNKVAFPFKLPEEIRAMKGYNIIMKKN